MPGMPPIDLDGSARRLRATRLPARPGVEVLHRSTGLRGEIIRLVNDVVEVRDRAGGVHRFRNLEAAFAHRGETVTLVAPAPAARGSNPTTRTSASGSVVAARQQARVAQASRIWVEGDHDARLLERVWGDDLREAGIVVEPLGGIDDLPAAVAEFGPGPRRRLAVLVDHLVPGSKEQRLAEAVRGEFVTVIGHPYVDVWQCVRASALGIPGWPEVPRGEDWKTGVCRRLGWADPRDGWRRVLAAVNSFADLDPTLVGAVESALDLLWIDGGADNPGDDRSD